MWWRANAVEKMNNSQNQSPVPEIGQPDFENEVLRSSLPVLVAFGALWSRPCYVCAAVLDEVAVACTGTAKVVKVNADDNPDLSLWYEIESIPTLLWFVGGEVRARIVGTASKEAILAKLQSALAGVETESTPAEINHQHEDDHS